VFKNLTVYRVGPEWQADLSEVEDKLQKHRFIPCGASQPVSMGWVEPRGQAHGPLVESVAGQWIFKLMIEKKMLPGSVVKRALDERIKKIEQETGRKPGRKQGKELKEELMLELLPKAFTRQDAVSVWWSPEHRMLFVNAGSQGRADEVVGALVEALGGLPVSLLHTATSAAVAMAAWLTEGAAPAGFTIDRECELKSSDDMKATVRYARHALDIDEVRQHITEGKMPTRLALTWEERVSFVLTDTFLIKKLEYLDGVFEGRNQADEGFDADVAIATGELSQLLPDLVEALGGEQPLQGAASVATASPSSQTAAAPAAPVQTLAPASVDDSTPPWEA
jgi:recombination associated protein RdgC